VAGSVCRESNTGERLWWQAGNMGRESRKGRAGVVGNMGRESNKSCEVADAIRTGEDSPTITPRQTPILLGRCRGHVVTNARITRHNIHSSQSAMWSSSMCTTVSETSSAVALGHCCPVLLAAAVLSYYWSLLYWITGPKLDGKRV
jgi:hypothetical protein